MRYHHYYFAHRPFGYRTHFLCGTHSWEVQIGRHVFQMRRRNIKPEFVDVPRFHHFTDPYGKR